MRRIEPLVCALILAAPLLAQAPPQTRRASARADMAQLQVRQASEQLAAEKKVYEADVQVLQHLRAADVGLTDPMQPNNALQKAYESVGKAKPLATDQLVLQGIIQMERELEAARRSAATADFPRLRSLLRDHALGPASRVAVRNALRLEEEMQAWIRLQQMIADHLRNISSITSDSLRASEQP